MIMKLHTLVPMSQGCALLILGSKGQSNWTLMIENGFRTITDSVIHLWYEPLYTCSPWVKDVPYWFQGQRSRSWGIDDWKLFLNHNWLCNPPMILKVNTLAPHESRRCPFDFGVKGHGALVIENGFWIITDSVIHIRSWNFIHLLLRSQGCALLILGSKVLGSWGLKIVKNFPCTFKEFFNFFLTKWPWPWSWTYFSKTLTLVITYELWKTWLSYFTCVFLVTRPFTSYHNFWPSDLDLEVGPTFQKL